jgi:hypothetical protein
LFADKAVDALEVKFIIDAVKNKLSSTELKVSEFNKNTVSNRSG